jgi:hypothetical protein
MDLKYGHAYLKQFDLPFTVTPEGVTLVDGTVNVLRSGLVKLPFIDIAPWEVSGHFYCDHNELIDLEGAPRSVGGNFHCQHNQLISLSGAPARVGDEFRCHDNKLTNLNGAPLWIGGTFWCDHNELITLVGAPQTVKGSFWCQTNMLVDFVGLGQVTGTVFAADNAIISRKGLPDGTMVIGVPESVLTGKMDEALDRLGESNDLV